MFSKPMQAEFKQAPHLELLTHRSPHLRKQCADLAGQYTRVAKFETELLAKYLDLEVYKRRGIVEGLLDDDLEPIEAVIDSLCNALGRIAQGGGDISVAVPFLVPLVYEKEETLVRLSAAFALRAYHKNVQSKRGAA